MSATGKILSGILAFLPLLLFAGYFVMFFGMVFQVFQDIDLLHNTVDADTEIFLKSFLGILFLILLLGFVSLVKLIYFIVHILNNKKLDSNEKLIWILVGIFAGMFGFPIYWYLKIWKEEEEPAYQGF